MKTLSGLLVLDKPEGMSSRQAVTRVSKVLRAAGYDRKIKVGHCGTLDPLATGVLVICIGKATRLVPLVQELRKTYLGRFLLGQVTSTDDFTGKTIREADVTVEAVNADAIAGLLPEFTGHISQVPPKFSAVHVDGKRAYKLARKGHDVDLEPRTVHVHKLELTGFECPEFELLIECGSGTYVRSIGRDIGERLGCGATMKALTRTAIGPFRIDMAIPVDELDPESITSHVLPPVEATRQLPAVTITAQEASLIRNGRAISARPPEQKPQGDHRETASGATESSDNVRVALVTSADELVAIASPGKVPGTLKPDIVFHETA